MSHKKTKKIKKRKEKGRNHKYMKTIYQLKWLYVVTLSTLFFISCDPLKFFGAGSVSGQYSLVPTEGLSTSHIPNEKFFYVNIDSAYYKGKGFDALDAIIYAMDDGPGTDCKIPVEEDSTGDLYCIIDAMEGDLWFHSIVLEYNVPEGMCDYLDFEVPWHFNQRVGNGPSPVHECNNYAIKGSSCTGEEGNNHPETETRYCLGSCVTDLSNCGNGDAVIITIDCEGAGPLKEAKDFCNSLDLSDNKLANCCLGEYILKSTDSSTEANWGGDLKNCIGGLARTNWNAFNEDGLPIILTTNTLKDGYKNTYEMPALIDLYGGNRQPKLGFPSFITANYWTNIEDKNFTSSKPKFYTAPTTSQLPKSYLRSLPIQGYPYLTWTCLDKAREIKHRINVGIREWNTQEEYNSFKETKGSRGDPDIEGQEGSFCEYYEAEENDILKSTLCNDIMDLDDWEKEDHGSGSNYNPYPEVIYK